MTTLLHTIFPYTGNSSAGAVETAAGLFWADGCLCILFALATHFKYTRSAKTCTELAAIHTYV